MAQEPKRHLIGIERFASGQGYKYPRPVIPKFPIASQNRAIHGNRIKNQIQAIRDQFELNQDQEVPEGLVRDEVIYVEFFSEWGFEFKYEQLHSDSKGFYQILKVTKEVRTLEDREQKRYRVLVMLAKRGVAHFLKRVDEYLTKNTKKDGIDTGTPQAQPLIANLNEVKLATLEAFWVDIETTSFPMPDQEVWWEI